MKTRMFAPLVAVAALVVLALLPAAASAGEEREIIELVEGTAVLLDVNTTGGGGAGGNSVPASSATNIFSPSTLVDYKRFGGEPSIAVDRYPFTPTNKPSCTSAVTLAPNPSCVQEAACPPGQTTCFKDLVYQSAPQGVVDPHYSQFWKSNDQGLSFRKSQQFPIYGLEQINAGGGGGDSHQAVGELTHDVYFVDLTLAPGITMNVSQDLGETWRSDPVGQGLSFVDDRQWVEADEAADRVYVSTINLLNPATTALVSIENHTGWPTAGQLTEECNPTTYTQGLGTSAAPATGATFCPDPADPYLWTAGPVVADNEGTATRPPSHNAYIPFIRRISEPLGTGLFGIDAWQLWVAKTTDQGHTWTRHLVALLPNTVNPSNIFPQLTIDRGGNLYYTWSQAQALTTSNAETREEETHPGEGEQDAYYAWSTTAGATWSQPINLTKEQGDSAVFPWMIAGDPGQVDVVMYKSNSGVNSNFALVDDQGGCEEDEDAPNPCDANARPNPAVWNVYFGQSQNALNTGPNFKLVQVTAEPHHIGQICSGGLGCEGDRDLLDFFTVDVDHLGAAHIAYSHDHRSRNSDTQDRMTRQIGGNSVFKGQALSLQSLWPEKNHTVADRSGDVTNTESRPIGSCAGMDILSVTSDRHDGVLTVSMTLNGAPTALGATACGGVASSGGIWGVEFWAPSSTFGGADQANQFYVAYRDDLVNGARVEGGTVDNVNLAVTSLEYQPRESGTLGGTCLPPVGPPATGTCTITMTVPLDPLGIKSGDALNSLTGLSLYFFGTEDRPVGTRAILGNSEQADAAAPINYQGTAQTTN